MTRAVLSLAAIALFVTAAPAQPRTDPIGNARTGQRIADQKAEALVEKAISDADKLMRSRPDKAIQYLRSALSEIDLSNGISTEKRRALTAQLTAKLAAVRGKPSPAAAPPGARVDPRGTALRTTKQSVWEAYLAETKAVQDGIAKIKYYEKTNQRSAAAAVINDLAAKYPDNPATIALTRKGSLDDAVKNAGLYAQNAADRMNKAYIAVDQSASPAIRDVEFPAGWKEKMKNRTDVNAVKLTERERKIIEALDKPVNVSGSDKPFDYLLQELSTAMDQKLAIDKASLSDLDVDLKSNASLDARGVTARTALRQLLASKGLTYIIKDEIIQVVTVQKARESLTTRVYYLGDVVQGIGSIFPGGGPVWGPFLDMEQTTFNVKTVVGAIEDSVDPLSWKKHGGPGTITFHYPTMSIIVRASSEVHSALGSKLSRK